MLKRTMLISHQALKGEVRETQRPEAGEKEREPPGVRKIFKGHCIDKKAEGKVKVES